jgi:hypothetical protein
MYFCDFLMKKFEQQFFMTLSKPQTFSLLARVTRRLDKKITQIWKKLAKQLPNQEMPTFPHQNSI